ncbi:MAG: nucleoside deaminase [Bacteroidia bacterium]|nr:nucleoside deaminase [Bacteroidia bacterium]
MTEDKKKFMREAIRLSIENIDNGGGPFGAVIVKDGTIISRGTNRVTIDNDPTAHAEIIAIRDASRFLGTFDLSGCEIYASCEPCPMCLGAIYWARLDKIYFANTKADAADIEFGDSFIYNEIEKPYKKRTIETVQLLQEDAKLAFNKWKDKEDKVKY